MTTEIINWNAVASLSGRELKGEVFSILQQASLSVQTDDVDDPELLAIIPRLAALIEKKPELQNYREVLSALARSVGLWNYIDKSVADARDELTAEIASFPDLGIVLHREQHAALNLLLSGQNLILSAPTSFGKSILIDALLLHERYRRVAIVLPTIALLDEFRRRLIKRFGDKYDVLMHHSEKSTQPRVIFLESVP
jgi:reverse gyrase